jgi:hypothetical protein
MCAHKASKVQGFLIERRKSNWRVVIGPVAVRGVLILASLFILQLHGGEPAHLLWNLLLALRLTTLSPRSR